MDCSLPGSSVHGIFQPRILEWVAISSPGDLPDPGIEPRSPALQADALPSEPREMPNIPADVHRFKSSYLCVHRQSSYLYLNVCEINSDHCVYGYTFERTANDFIVSAQLSTVVCESQEYILRKNSKGLMLSPRRPISLGSFYDIFFFLYGGSII